MGAGWPGGLARRASNLKAASSNRIAARSRDSPHRRGLSVTVDMGKDVALCKGTKMTNGHTGENWLSCRRALKRQ